MRVVYNIDNSLFLENHLALSLVNGRLQKKIAEAGTLNIE